MQRAEQRPPLLTLLAFHALLGGLSAGWLAPACTGPQPAAAETRAEVASASEPALADVAAPAAVRAPAAPGSPAAAVTARTRAAEERRVVADLIDLARQDNRVEDHLRHLCLAIGPRLTSSHNLAVAEQWTLEQFRAWGLDARLERWGEFPVGFDRGPWRGRIVGASELELEFMTPAWSAGTGGPRRAGAVRRPETLEELEAAKDAFAGKWVVAPPPGSGRGGGRAAGPREQRSRISAELAKLGIAGEVSGVAGELLVTSGRHEIRWDDLPQVPRIVLRADHHKEVLARLEQDPGLELEFDVDNRFYAGPVEQSNVLADIRGSELPDEIVIVGGHLDSWDGAQGAVDNGTGVATTMEAARLLAAVGARPRRTIRFALWTGEEQGLFGSEGYVRDHADELDRISAVYIHDGGTNYLSGLGVTYDMEAQMRAVCAPVFGLDPQFPFELRVTDGMRYSPDSDHAPFANAGVPGFFWDQAGRSKYQRMHHTQHDTFETAIPEYQRHSALVAALVAYNTANLPELLSRDNFKAPPPRRMGVVLDGTQVGEVLEGELAEAAGWRVGDVLLSIDGVEVKTRRQANDELQKGGPRKVVALRRGDETLESVLDYADSPEEAARQKRAALRAAREQRSELEKKKLW